MRDPIDAVIVVSFGGPEGPEDVMPFLRRVTAGRGVPDDRLHAVAAHYHRFGGVSPINERTRALVAALSDLLASDGPAVDVYWGNRNWHPLLEDTVGAMARDGIRHAAAFVTSAYSSFPSCRQYLDDIERARRAVGPTAPRITKVRPFFNHPGFVDAVRARARDAISDAPPAPWHAVFTAHSIPAPMAEASDYEAQLRDVASIVGSDLGLPWSVAYQSRSGAPSQPWLGPDIADHLDELASAGARAVLAIPAGFVADHMEVVHDLDVVAADHAAQLGLQWRRAGTAGTHPAFVAMARSLICEIADGSPASAIGSMPPRPAPCEAGCCPPAPGG